MNASTRAVARQARELPSKGRAELAYDLIRSLDQCSVKDVDVLWNVEIQRRVKEIKTGKVRGRPAMDVLAELRATFS